jgi:hypothetical protein
VRALTSGHMDETASFCVNFHAVHYPWPWMKFIDQITVDLCPA